jgi:hypothetical protein
LSEEEREMLKRNKAVSTDDMFQFLAAGVPAYQTLADNLGIKPSMVQQMILEKRIKLKHLNAVRRKHILKKQWGTFKRVLREIKKAK